MADSDSKLKLAHALHYLGQELKKRMDDFGAECLELRKREAAAVKKDDGDMGADLAMSELCKSCGLKKALCKCMGKDEVPASERGEGSVLPDDKKAKEISAEGSGGDVKKLKKDALAPKASPPPIPADAKPKAPAAPKMGAGALPAAPKTPAMGAGSPQAGGLKSPAMAGAAIPPPPPGQKPMKLPGLTLPKGPGVSAPIKTNARLGKEELGKTAISPRDAAADQAKRPVAAASAGKLMDSMLGNKAPMPAAVPASAPAPQLAGVGQPIPAPAKGVQTMAERVASSMGPSGATLAGPPRIALPGAGLFAKKPAAVPPPVPADAKPAIKPVK